MRTGISTRAALKSGNDVLWGAEQEDLAALHAACQAARCGEEGAWEILARMLGAGYGLPHHACKTVLWLRRMIKAGYNGAAYALGAAYEQGYCVQTDLNEAARWYQYAGERGERAAQLALGWMYLEGRGVTQSDQAALTWLQITPGTVDIHALHNGETGGEHPSLLRTFLAAQSGKAYAQFFLGEMYERGEEIADNREKAIFWYRKAALKDHPYAQVRLGDRLIDVDAEEALYWYRRAAAQDNGEARFKLACFYSEGNLVTRNDRKAFEGFRFAAEKGETIHIRAQAIERLGWLYETGRGVTCSHDEALRYFHHAERKYCDCLRHWERFHDDGALAAATTEADLDAACDGDAEAQTLVGELYEKGIDGACKSTPQAMMWYRWAAQQQHAKAQSHLGRLCEMQHQPTRNYQEAVFWYRLAAQQNYPEAQFRLGWLYHKGLGVARNGGEAKKWLHRAVEGGHVNACLGLAYLSRSAENRFKWLSQAARQGSAIAAFNLATLYTQAKSGLLNRYNAMKWYRTAAESGNGHAQLMLGWKHATGLGVSRNDQEAVHWLRAAVKQNIEPAVYTLQAMRWRN